jgi:hypothetical protein
VRASNAVALSHGAQGAEGCAADTGLRSTALHCTDEAYTSRQESAYTEARGGSRPPTREYSLVPLLT